MSKHIIILCVVLFASVANSFPFADFLENITKNVDGVFKNTIFDNKDKSTAPHKNSQEISKKISDGTTTNSDKLPDNKNIFEIVANSLHVADFFENIKKNVQGVFKNTIFDNKDKSTVANGNSQEISEKVFDEPTTNSDKFPDNKNIFEIAGNEINKLTKWIQKGSEQMLVEATKNGEKLGDDIKNSLLKANDEIFKFTNDVVGNDIIGCVGSADYLNHIAYAVIPKMSACIGDKLEIGFGYVKGIISDANDMLANVTEIRKEVNCNSSLNDMNAVTEVIACHGIATVKTAWIVNQFYAEIAMKISDFISLLATIKPSLGQCVANKAQITFYNESMKTVKEIIECIQRKFEYATKQLFTKNTRDTFTPESEFPTQQALKEDPTLT